MQIILTSFSLLLLPGQKHPCEATLLAGSRGEAVQEPGSPMPGASGGTRGWCAARGNLGHGFALVQPGILLNAEFLLRPVVASCEDPVPILHLSRGTRTLQPLQKCWRDWSNTSVHAGCFRERECLFPPGRSVMEQLCSVQTLGDAEIIQQDIDLFLLMEALEAIAVSQDVQCVFHQCMVVTKSSSESVCTAG